MAQQQSHYDGAERLARGRALLEAYGANPAQWPREDAPLFETLKSDPLFAAARDEAAELDELLAVSPNAAADDALKTRILADFPVRGAVRSAGGAGWFRSFRRLAPASALAGLSALGFVLGASTVSVASQDEADIYYAFDTSIIEVAEGDAFWAEDGS